MPSILILRPTNTDKSAKFFNQIPVALAAKGLHVSESSVREFANSKVVLEQAFKKYDAIIFLGFALFANEFLNNTTTSIIKDLSPNDLKFILVGHEGDQNYLNDELLSKILFFSFVDESSDTLKDLVADITEVLSVKAFKSEHEYRDQMAAAVVENIKRKGPDYIAKTRADLVKRENALMGRASRYYIFSVVSLGLSIITALIMLGYTAAAEVKDDWIWFLFLTIKGILVIALFLSAAKYCLTLGKAYTSESLKIADRIHAITFGDFYINVFENEIKSEELKEIFRDWNINNQSNSFSKDSSSDLNVTMLDKILDLAEKIRPAIRG